MPIYAYRCAACGHARDVLQKISDPRLTVCPVCGAEAFEKQVTAAGFQLKGSGWYVTDFRGGDSGKSATAKTDTAKSEDVKTEAPAPKADKPAEAAPAAAAPASTPTPGSST
ncbi:FmdB family transcriptional regulator [Rubrivivax gelatinosus]|uniref:FmdB family zinc ribbon protein n=1 Tax=Rubrivivax gelatinosus TaxID=28068 RepID=UPI0019074863|nr:FmdB family zinc ribbon protein [Rubrivivax gelatinosus]MBK1613301.1 FmdB family transcriptional regulator [Rubrivivax gelatinosus]